MFKKASMKIMPQSNTTSSSRNEDARPIQSLLTAEKTVLLSLQKLSADYGKAAEALRTWGLSEDNDLGGILTASTSLFNHFSLALSQYVSHGHTMQRQLEVMAKKGESLDNLKQRRNSTHQKAEETATQLNKMKPDNKYYSMHSEALRRLRKDVRKMEEDIRLEETILMDHKQTATKVWMRLKFDGLYECCEKGAIAGKYGKLVTSEFEGLEDLNQPGMPRNLQLQSKIESFILEADRHVNAVGLSVVGSRNSDRNIEESSNTPSAAPQIRREEPAPLVPPKSQVQPPQNVPPSHGGNLHFPPERQDSSFSISSSRPYAPHSNQQQFFQKTPNSFRSSPTSLDDFGPNGAVPNPRGQFSSPPRQPGLPETGGQFGLSDPGGQHSLRDPVNGRREPLLASEPNAGPSRLQEPPTPWQQQQQQQQHWQQYPIHMRPPESGYAPQDPPPSQGGRHLQTGESYPAGPTRWQGSPIVLHPPVPSDPAYPPSQGGSRPDGDSSYTTGPPHLQNSPVIMRPPVSTETGYPPLQGGSHQNDNSTYSAGPSRSPVTMRPTESGYPPSQGGGHLNDKYSAGPSHSPVTTRPPVSTESGYAPSQGGGLLNDNSTYSAGPSHSPVMMRPPVSTESGYAPSQGGGIVNDNSTYSAGPSHSPVMMRPPVSTEPGYPPSQGGSHLNGNSSYPAGQTSHLQSPPRPPGPPESGRYVSQDPTPLGGRGYWPHESHWQNHHHPTDRSSLPIPPPLPPTPLNIRHPNPSHLQGGGPINTGPNSSSSELGGYPLQDDGRYPRTNRFSGVSESTTVTSEGMASAFNNQSIHSWGGSGSGSGGPDDSPPAYALMGNPESQIPDTGHKKKW